MLRGAWSGTPFDFEGEHYKVAGATVRYPPSPTPEIFFGGASPAGREVAAAQADTYLTWTEPPAQVAELIGDVRQRAERHGRTLTYGIRAHVIARDTSEEAWAEAARLQARMDPAVIAKAQQRFSRSDSEGQRLAGVPGGVGQRAAGDPPRPAGPATAWCAPVRARRSSAATPRWRRLIEEYAEIGIEHFILSGQPHLEEAYWVGEGVLPELRRRGRLGTGAADLRVPALA